MDVKKFVFATAMLVFGGIGANVPTGMSAEIILADGQAWPGRILESRSGRVDAWFSRPAALPDGDVPRVQSLAILPSGQVLFCSGLDRSIYEISGRSERRFHHGGYLARQVRVDADGMVYWSGIETPRDGQPLPDGFIYSWNPSTREIRTVLTFSQQEVGHDWWGTFDVHNGRIYVGTLRDHTRLYDVTTSTASHFGTLPFAATAFRFASDGSLYACDGHGKLVRFANPSDLTTFDVILVTSTPFADFSFPIGSTP